jgi:hypothetical protein
VAPNERRTNQSAEACFAQKNFRHFLVAESFGAFDPTGLVSPTNSKRTFRIVHDAVDFPSRPITLKCSETWFGANGDFMTSHRQRGVCGLTTTRFAEPQTGTSCETRFFTLQLSN